MTKNRGRLRRQKRELLFYGLNILLPLLLGTLVYCCFRPDTYIARFLYAITGLQWEFSVLYAVCPAWLRLFLRNFLADMLWAYALTFSTAFIWYRERRSTGPVIVICILFEAGIEACQQFGIISGTFDWLDILLEICITAYAALLIKKHKE